MTPNGASCPGGRTRHPTTSGSRRSCSSRPGWKRSKTTMPGSSRPCRMSPPSPPRTRTRTSKSGKASATTAGSGTCTKRRSPSWMSTAERSLRRRRNCRNSPASESTPRPPSRRSHSSSPCPRWMATSCASMPGATCTGRTSRTPPPRRSPTTTTWSGCRKTAPVTTTRPSWTSAPRCACRTASRNASAAPGPTSVKPTNRAWNWKCRWSPPKKRDASNTATSTASTVAMYSFSPNAPTPVCSPASTSFRTIS